jgi:soluble lytic murein transglycosylase-like protein
MTIQQRIEQAALARGVDPKLALAVARKESAFNQSARSRVGAIGVFQLMPKTAAWLGVDPYDLQQNIEGGIDYLARLIASYKGDLNLVLAAYNWGPGNLSDAIGKWGADWLAHAPAETRNYLSTIFGWLSLPFGSPGTTVTHRTGPDRTMLLVAAGILGLALILILRE